MGSATFDPRAKLNARSVKTVAICADDFGFDPHVNQAIVELSKLGRLTATSVLVDAGVARSAAQTLLDIDIDIGLHLNLTEVVGDLTTDQVMPLKQLILRAQTRQLSVAWVRGAIDRQISRFEAQFGRLPDYIDGHLHVHQLPVVAEQLLAVLDGKKLPAGFWIRDTRAGVMSGSPWSERFKSWVVGHLGMGGLARQATRRQIGMNQGFFGVYDFTGQHRPFMQMMQGWLTAADSGALLMTHPATRVLDGDPIGSGRVQEYAELASPAFGDLLDTQQIKLARLSQVLSDLP